MKCTTGFWKAKLINCRTWVQLVRKVVIGDFDIIDVPVYVSSFEDGHDNIHDGIIWNVGIGGFKLLFVSWSQIACFIDDILI